LISILKKATVVNSIYHLYVPSN